MASYHFSVKSSNRKGGKKIAASNHNSYITREAEHKKENDCVYTEAKLPAWARTPKQFWEAADKYERQNGNTYKELEFFLQNALPLKENLKIIHELTQQEPLNQFYYSLAIHDKKVSGLSGERNLHCHIMFSERVDDGIERDAATFFKRANPKNPAKGGAKKSRFLAGKEGRTNVKALRKLYADITNKVLQENGITATINHRTLKDQKQEAIRNKNILAAAMLDREPQRYLGNFAINRDAEAVQLTKRQIAMEKQRQQLIKKYASNLIAVKKLRRREKEKLNHERPFKIARTGIQIFRNIKRVSRETTWDHTSRTDIMQELSLWSVDTNSEKPTVLLHGAKTANLDTQKQNFNSALRRNAHSTTVTAYTFKYGHNTFAVFSKSEITKCLTAAGYQNALKKLSRTNHQGYAIKLTKIPGIPKSAGANTTIMLPNNATTANVLQQAVLGKIPLSSCFRLLNIDDDNILREIEEGKERT